MRQRDEVRPKRPDASDAAPAEMCIYCKQPLLDPTIEHVIPESLGGTLTITSVCRACNGRLGQDVDRIANDRLFLSLREDVGLPLPHKRRVAAEYWDSESGKRVPVWLRHGNGRFVEQIQTEVDGDSITIRDETAEEVLEAARRLTEKRAARGGLVPRWSEPVVREHASPALIIRPEAGQSRFPDQLDRLACQIALGYIADAAGAEIALDVRLDNARACALEGRPLETTVQEVLLPEGKDTAYLPRVQRYFPLRRDAYERLPDPAEIQRRADAGEPTSDLFPRAFSLDRPFHAIGFLRNDSRAVVRVILFGLLQIDVDIPTDLNVPWGRVYDLDFAP